MNAHSKTAGLAGRDGLGISKAVAAPKYHFTATPVNIEDCGSFESIGTISRRVLVNSMAARLRVSPELASVTVELAQLARRAA